MFHCASIIITTKKKLKCYIISVIKLPKKPQIFSMKKINNNKINLPNLEKIKKLKYKCIYSFDYSKLQ